MSVFRLAAVLLLLAVSAPMVLGQEDSDCLDCHGDPDLFFEDGAPMFGFIDPADLSTSVHTIVGCVDCHISLEGAELPHEFEVDPVACGECHDDEAGRFAASMHGQALAAGDELAPSCADCHGSHKVLSHTDPASPTAIMNIPATCGVCHHEGTPVSRTHDIPQESILENYSLSIHGEGLFDKGLTVTAVCTSCHTSHDILPHTDPASTIHKDNVAATCTACHSQIERVHRKVIDGRLWEEQPHVIPACVDCHAPHEVRQAYYPAGMANRDCMACHAAFSLTMDRGGETISLFVDEGDYSSSAHAGTACAQCHTDVSASLERPCATSNGKVDCAVCHAEPVEMYQSGTHGQLQAAGDTDAPDCAACHGKHAVMKSSSPASPTFPSNVPNLCGECHAEGGSVSARNGGSEGGSDGNGSGIDAVAQYRDSIHGKGLTDSGLLVTATCASCHGAHNVLPSHDPDSRVSSDHVADTCGECHYGIEETFRLSVHWPGEGDAERAEGDELPTCKDCHSAHSISRTDVGGFRSEIMDQCGKCHSEQEESFYDTFHGKVSRLGDLGAAKCHDCHGTHGILPADHSASMLSSDNIVATCGNCHEGSHRQFTGYLAHATHNDRERWPWLFWTFWAMTSLLVGTMSVALLHTLLFWVRLMADRKEWKAHQKAIREGRGDLRLYRRFDRYTRTLHMLMVVSFLTLALTGMMLKFSDSGWAATLSGWMGGFDTTGTLHRIAALWLVAVFAWHVRSALIAKRTRKQTWWQLITAPDSILFNKRDLGEVKATLAWFVGKGKRPRYERYTYWEKFDYMAVFWGVAVIGLTGFALWFPELATLILPGWALNVATIVHGDEALLAVAFIFTVHFFNANLRPDKFPMDPTMFTGRMTVAELEYERPEEYERLVGSGELENQIVEPLPAAAERSLKAFGGLALLVGLTLIVLIVYALFFD